MEQKEFGLRRQARVMIGRGRKKAADSVMKKIEKNWPTKHTVLKEVSNPGARERMVSRTNVKIIPVEKHKNGGIVYPKKRIIVYQEGHDDTLAHELGHLKNREGGLSKIIAESSLNKRGKKHFRSVTGGKSFEEYLGKDKSVVDSAKDYLGSKVLIQEEKNANKNARRLMKEAGYTPEEIKKAEKNNRDALDTYKRKSSIMTWADIYKKIQIPSRLKNSKFIQEDFRKARGK